MTWFGSIFSFRQTFVQFSTIAVWKRCCLLSVSVIWSLDNGARRSQAIKNMLLNIECFFSKRTEVNLSVNEKNMKCSAFNNWAINVSTSIYLWFGCWWCLRLWWWWLGWRLNSFSKGWMVSLRGRYQLWTSITVRSRPKLWDTLNPLPVERRTQCDPHWHRKDSIETMNLDHAAIWNSSECSNH